MAKNLPAWLFMAISLTTLSLALQPILRFALGLDPDISMPFTTVVVLMIAGLMSGLTAMILLTRRAPRLTPPDTSEVHCETPFQNAAEQRSAVLMHASGLLLFTAIPLANFLVGYWLWTRFRHRSPVLNQVGQDVLNFQMSVYLYVLLSLFLVFALLGILTTPLIFFCHALISLVAIIRTALGKPFIYPLNIPIIQGRTVQ